MRREEKSLLNIGIQWRSWAQIANTYGGAYGTRGTPWYFIAVLAFCAFLFMLFSRNDLQLYARTH